MTTKRRNARAIDDGHSQFRHAIDDKGNRIAIVTLTRGMEAFLDADDWDRISEHYGFLWYANCDSNGRWYARREVPGAAHGKGGYHQITMQRAVLEAGRREYITFANGNTLDCRRSNLLRNEKPRQTEAAAELGRKAAAWANEPELLPVAPCQNNA